MQLLSPAMVLPAVALVFACAFFVIWYADKDRRHLLGFGFGFLTLFVAMSAHIGLPELDTETLTPIFHALACMSVISIIWGAAERVHQGMPWVAMLSITAISTFLLWAALRSEEPTATLFVQNGASGLLFAFGAFVLWSARPTAKLDIVLVWTIGLLAATGLLRPVLVLLSSENTNQVIERQSSSTGVLLIVITSLTVVLATTLIVIAMREALEIRLGARKLDHQSGFWDRDTFRVLCEEKSAEAFRRGHTLTLTLLAVDHFGELTERWGSEITEFILRDVAKVLREFHREGDVIGTTREGEFGVLSIGMNSNSAAQLTRQIRDQALSKLNKAGPSDMHITLSFGIVEVCASKTFDEFLQRATDSLKGVRNEGGVASTKKGERSEESTLCSYKTDGSKSYH